MALSDEEIMVARDAIAREDGLLLCGQSDQQLSVVYLFFDTIGESA